MRGQILEQLKRQVMKKTVLELRQQDIKNLKNKRPGFSDDRYDETEYYFDPIKKSNSYKTEISVISTFETQAATFSVYSVEF